MDADRFDALLRSLSGSPSRREALRLLAGTALGGTLGWLRSAEATARKRRKKKRKKKRRCAPRCAGKTCGPNGCGGSCGACTGGACDAGTCLCSPPTAELCRGNCVSPCQGAGIEFRDPVACTCCRRNLIPCGSDSDCCSGSCVNTGGGGASCIGRKEGESCQFPLQCADGICTDGVCRCPSGRPPCGNGRCADLCQSGWVRVPETCRCCLVTDANCSGTLSDNCCAGPTACQAGGDTCAGRPDNQECEFDAQCASGKCRLSRCGTGTIGG